jgi:hypothetical protein
MAKLTPNASAIDERTSKIAHAIRAAMSPVMDADELRTAANNEAQDASEGAVNARELVMQNLALAAMQGKWTEGEVDRAIRVAVTMSNAETPKSIVTFMGETRRAMHPNVRIRFADLVKVRNAVWDEEEMARMIARLTKTEAHTPVRKAFVRKYHALAALMGEAEKGIYHTATTFVTFAESRDPDFNVDRQAKAVAMMMRELGIIAGRFPDSDLAAAVDFLGKVTKQSLEAARREHHGVEEVVTTVVPAIVTPDASSASNVDIAEGASDILDDVLAASA